MIKIMENFGDSLTYVILHIGLTSHYCFHGSGSHYELGENIMRYQARRGCTII